MLNKTNAKAWALEWTNTLVFAFVAAIIIRSFVIQVFWIPSESMLPSFKINDRIIVNKLAYGIQNPLFESYKEKTFLYIIPNPLYNHPVPLSHRQYLVDFNLNPKRFDVIVFKLYDVNGNRKDLIKRLIGMPGETFQLKMGTVYINGKPLKETHPMNFDEANYGPVKIPNDSFFMMGDNRPNSADSRYWGFLPKSQVIGPAVIRIWPIWEFGLVPK